MSKYFTFIQSLRHALDGIGHSFKKEKNFRRMTIISLVVIVASIFFGISFVEWILVMWAISTVLIAEMVNTSVEYIIDLIHKRKDIHAKLAKDVAAGAVLLATFWSIIVGIVVFVPKIIYLF